MLKTPLLSQAANNDGHTGKKQHDSNDYSGHQHGRIRHASVTATFSVVDKLTDWGRLVQVNFYEKQREKERTL